MARKTHKGKGHSCNFYTINEVCCIGVKQRKQLFGQIPSN